jgi:hypothetical protein
MRPFPRKAGAMRHLPRKAGAMRHLPRKAGAMRHLPRKAEPCATRLTLRGYTLITGQGASRMME